ncbi:MAG: dienelactone hydrolase family protein [Planctomycetota bacterium]|jgi:dienelactone hydrolase
MPAKTPVRPRFLPLLWLVAGAVLSSAAAQERDFNAYPDAVVRYLERMYDQGRREFAFGDDFPGGVEAWRKAARAALRARLGLDGITASAGGHHPRVELEAPEDLGDYTRQAGLIETEPDVRVPLWLLRPKGEGPWPIGVFPHGHDSVGHNTSAGVYPNDDARRKAIAEDRDVAVQAVKRGYLAVAPAVRGLSTNGVPDLYGRHGKRPCRSQLMHCLLAGRTAIGERVWDMERILDWTTELPDANPKCVLMMGNSGGGMVTLYAAACDERVTVAVPSCSFAPLTSPAGYIFHCDCNMVPGMAAFGDLSDVAGLIAPRYLLAVSGRGDSLHSEDDVDRAAARVRVIYQAAGCRDRFDHRWGNAGHRFYKDLMWPFVTSAIEKQGL